jgi:hypothetical protein
MPHRSDPVHIQPQQRCHRAPERSANARRGARRRRARGLHVALSRFCRKGAFSRVRASVRHGIPDTQFLDFAPKIELCDRVPASPPALGGNDARRAEHTDCAVAKVSWTLQARNTAALCSVEHRNDAGELSTGALPVRPLARAAPAFRGGLPGHRSIVVKDVTCHGLVAVPGANIVA